MKSDGFDLAAQWRRSGIDHMTAAELVTLRAYLAAKKPAKRIRELFPSGDSIIEPPIDAAWNALGRRPTAAEYRALAALCQEAASYCEREARRKL